MESKVSAVLLAIIALTLVVMSVFTWIRWTTPTWTEYNACVQANLTLSAWGLSQERAVEILDDRLSWAWEDCVHLRPGEVFVAEG